jgi:hypothetical protein
MGGEFVTRPTGTHDQCLPRPSRPDLPFFSAFEATDTSLTRLDERRNNGGACNSAEARRGAGWPTTT